MNRHPSTIVLSPLGGLLLAATALLSTPGCRTAGSEEPEASIAASETGTYGADFYEHQRIKGLKAAADCHAFQPATRITVTARDGSGNPRDGVIRVLVDHPSRRVYLLSAANQWGATRTDADLLRPIPGTPYYEGTIRGLHHGMQYRLEVDGRQMLDPAATLYTSQDYLEAAGEAASPPFLNSVFWDFDRPGAYKAQTPVVDLRDSPIIIAESEVYALARKFRHNGGEGPKRRGDTYRFVAESGLATELRKAGYNAIEFLPFNTSNDGDHWHFRYQVYGLYAPDSRYGSPDDFLRMIDAFNRAGIAVIMDAVVGHYPFQGNEGARSLNEVGPHAWTKADGKRLFGEVMSPWNTYRYDYANPFVRRFLADSVIHMMCRYGIAGVRFDNLDGIRLYDGPGGGGPEFLKELTKGIRTVRPEAILIAEMFFGHNPVLQSLDQGGFGINFRTHSDFFDFIKDNMLKPTEQIDMARLRGAIRDPFDWREAARVTYITNHDEAANRRDGATGSYVASLVNGGGWFYVERKSIAFASLAMLASAVYMDMPQLRLLQEGSFNDNSDVDWSLLKHESQRRTWDWFAALSTLVRDDRAFNFANFTAGTENHQDTAFGWRVISLQRRDPATGRTYLAVVNLGHMGINGYKFGVDLKGNLRVALDSDAQRFGGSGELAKRLTTGSVQVEDQPLHGKSGSVTLPYLAPFHVLVLRQ